MNVEKTLVLLYASTEKKAFTTTGARKHDGFHFGLQSFLWECVEVLSQMFGSGPKTGSYIQNPSWTPSIFGLMWECSDSHQMTPIATTFLTFPTAISTILRLSSIFDKASLSELNYIKYYLSKTVWLIPSA
eukprot:TRINITY_DN2572_c0_g1_i3.p1 TRINITY_DN2572_c0_g1~~TRINITY_DN2572_c0_g1_i3.p1  ORF type:complete len:131 (-),score=14.41 TRINITY_DN2572_c0_g1_i3:36-428(-)